LHYVFEDVLQVLGTFLVVPASAAAEVASRHPSLGYDLARVLHGEQEIELFAPVPTAAQSVNRARIEAVYDKGHAAHVVIGVDTELLDGSLLARNRLRLIVPGEGGFGGDRGPSVRTVRPETAPDAVYDVATLPQQAALYRMSGDRGALHIDPAVARTVGLPRPSLQGLCTWAMIAKAVLDHERAGGIGALAGFSARFTGPVFPGETLRVEVWKAAEGYRVEATVLERDAPALSNGLLRVHDAVVSP
jgi:acyl dehydratase